MKEKPFPAKICQGCDHLDSDSPSEYDPEESFCVLGLIFPKKETCKRRHPAKKTVKQNQQAEAGNIAWSPVPPAMKGKRADG